LPPVRYPIFDIPPDHAVMHTLYDVKEVEQVSNIRFWAQTGSVSERGSDSPQVNFRGIQDEHGRLMVVMAHNTDIPDTWERRRREQGILRPLLAERLRRRRQHHDLRDDPLNVRGQILPERVQPRMTSNDGVTEVVEAEGHLIDSQLMNAMFDTVVRHDAAFDVLDFRIGRTNDEPSFVSMRVTAKAPPALTDVLEALVALGCRIASARMRTSSPRIATAAPRGLLLDDQPPDVGAAWRRVGEGGHQRMDAAIVSSAAAPSAEAPRDPHRGTPSSAASTDQDRAGVPGARRHGFAFMTERDLIGAASKSACRASRQMMRRRNRRASGIASSPGPVVVHTGGGAYFCDLIRHGYVGCAAGRQRARRPRRRAGALRDVARRRHGKRTRDRRRASSPYAGHQRDLPRRRPPRRGGQRRPEVGRDVRMHPPERRLRPRRQHPRRWAAAGHGA
jgi:hypothetical protein